MDPILKKKICIKYLSSVLFGSPSLFLWKPFAWLFCRKFNNMAVHCWSDLLKAAKKTALISDGILLFLL